MKGNKKMSYKIFIDGKEGTTGLRIADRFKDRSDIEILEIPEEKRKDTEERKKYINAFSACPMQRLLKPFHWWKTTTPR